jgi:hypothetical protein
MNAHAPLDWRQRWLLAFIFFAAPLPFFLLAALPLSVSSR